MYIYTQRRQQRGDGGGEHLVAGALVDEFDRRHFSLGFPKEKKKSMTLAALDPPSWKIMIPNKALSLSLWSFQK
jgi:hypothetical protein